MPLDKVIKVGLAEGRILEIESNSKQVQAHGSINQSDQPTQSEYFSDPPPSPISSEVRMTDPSWVSV
jgi:hypothetical protein